MKYCFSFHGWNLCIQGWTVRLGVLFTGAAFVFTPISSQAAGNMKQGEALQWFAHLTASGVTGGNLTGWAEDMGLTPAGGWNLNADISDDDMALLLVQLFGYNPKRNAGNHKKTLQRDGINVDGGEDGLIDRNEFISMVDQFGFNSRLASVSRSSGSGVNGDNGHGGNIPPPGFRNPKNPHFGQEPNGIPGHVGIGNGANNGDKHNDR